MRRLLTTTTMYSLAALLGPLVAFLLTPLYIDAIGVVGYGTVDVVQTVVQLVLPLALWGIPTTMIARMPNEFDAQRRLFGGAMLLGVLVSLGLSGVLLGCARPIATAMQRDISQLLVVYAISLPFATMYGVVLALLRITAQVWRAVLLMCMYVCLLALARIVLVVWFDAGVYGMIEALAIANVLSALVATVITWRWWCVWAWPEAWCFAQLGAPLVPAGVAVWMLLFIDRWFLVRYVSPLEQGQYALAVLMASVMAFIAEPFKQAWQPIARTYADMRFDAWSLTWYLAGALWMSALIATLAPDLLHIIGGNDAVPAAAYVPWLTLAPLLSGVVAIVSMPALRAGRTARLAWATMIGAGVNIGLNVWLIPQYGAQGAAWATAVAALVIPAVHVGVHRGIQPISYEWWRMAVLLGMWVTYVVVLPWLGDSWWLRLMVLIGFAGLLGVVIKVWQWRRWRMVVPVPS